MIIGLFVVRGSLFVDLLSLSSFEYWLLNNEPPAVNNERSHSIMSNTEFIGDFGIACGTTGSAAGLGDFPLLR